MTDEDGVEEKYQPTRTNMVRRLSSSCPMLTHHTHASFQKREIRALNRRVQPGDRRVFYCMSLLPGRSMSLISSPITSRRSLGPDALHD